MSNVLDYTHSIDITHLPQTIIDAILVTHEIGLDYLWVDSLCIIQDDDHDKTRELARMRLIYRNAYITLCAASARGASEGFLQDRPAHPAGISSSMHDAVLPFICGPDEQGRYSVGRVSITLISVNSVLGDAPFYDPRVEPIPALTSH